MMKKIGCILNAELCQISPSCLTLDEEKLGFLEMKFDQSLDRGSASTRHHYDEVGLFVDGGLVFCCWEIR